MATRGTEVVKIPVDNPGEFYKLFKERAFLLPDICPSIVHRIDLADRNQSWVDTPGSQKWIFIKPPTASINSLEAIKNEVAEIEDRSRKITFDVKDGKILEIYQSFKVTLEVVPGVAQWTIVYTKGSATEPDPVLYGGLLIDVSVAVNSHLRLSTG